MSRRCVRGRFVCCLIQVGDDGAPRPARPENTKIFPRHTKKLCSGHFGAGALSGSATQTMDRLRPRRTPGPCIRGACGSLHFAATEIFRDDRGIRQRRRGVAPALHRAAVDLQRDQGLEESFGVKLFIRHHAQGVSLTPSGTRFYRKAQELLRIAHEFEQNALADNDVITGQIDIGCFETVAPLYLPQLIAGFRERYPGVNIRLRDGDQQELVQGLTSGTFDLALMYDHDLDGTIETEPLMPPQQPRAAAGESPVRGPDARVVARPLCGADDPARRAAEPHVFRQPLSRTQPRRTSCSARRRSRWCAGWSARGSASRCSSRARIPNTRTTASAS